MVHPGSKVILSSGLPLELFCLAYIGIRLIAQIPFVIKYKSYQISNFGQLKIICMLGLVGVALQLSEFSGIADGANVSTVTFLVYTHPFWSILISKFGFKEKLGVIGIIKLVLAFIGILLVVGIDNFNIENLLTHWVSLAAGLFIAIWIKVSNIARKEGFSTLKTSFYYDLMSFSCLSLLIYLSPKGLELSILSTHLTDSHNLILLTTYSIVIGLLPNLLFYKGSATTDSLTAGYILLLEPIIASFTAYLVWGDGISVTFMVGAMLILSANIPNSFFEKKIIKSKVQLMFFFLIFAGITGFSEAGTDEPKKIVLLEIIPSDSSEYTVSSEKKQILIAAQMALENFLAQSKCNLQIENLLEAGNEERLVTKVKQIQKDKADKIIVGLSRTNFARVAAKVAENSNLRAISVGASASNLGSINNKFMTVVNPWEEQFNLVKKAILDNKCKPEDTAGIFNPGNYLSSNFMKSFEAAKLGKSFKYSEKSYFDSNKKCVFIGLNFSEASVLLSTLIKSEWKGTIIGTGDWNIEISELTKITSKLSSEINISVPTGWISNSSHNSLKFDLDFKIRSKETASPIAAYVYDGVILASESLCNGVDLYNQTINSPLMLRHYKGRNNTGNLLSEMYMIQLKGGLHASR